MDGRSHNPASRQPASQKKRIAGNVDATDVIVGVLLAVGVPILATVVLAAFGFPLTGTDEVVDRNQRREQVSLTDRELKDLYTVATTILEGNGRFYMEKWRGETDSIAKLEETGWTKQTLELSRSHYDSFIKAVSASPGSYPGPQELLNSASARIREIDGYLGELARWNAEIPR